MRIKCLTKKAFREWLESKNPRTRVGRQRSECGCPIARYLSDNGLVGVRVYKTDIYFDKKDGREQSILASWGVRFIEKVDAACIFRKDNAITASKALQILEKC